MSNKLVILARCAFCWGKLLLEVNEDAPGPWCWCMTCRKRWWL